MIEIKVLGPGCANCKRLEQIARSVIDELAVEANIIKVTDYAEIVDLGVMSTPGLIINDKVVSSGRIPSVDEVENWVKEAL
ncbi:MAG: thioredoxin family protein [Anaerolineaceae bacterium]|jgi:small redox-active disulfide protein 2|nr:MAG: thioredoxin family protein [Anaerolineaceae bacterium]